MDASSNSAAKVCPSCQKPWGVIYDLGQYRCRHCGVTHAIPDRFPPPPLCAECHEPTQFHSEACSRYTSDSKGPRASDAARGVLGVPDISAGRGSIRKDDLSPGRAIPNSATDVQSLLDLAAGWRETERKMRRDHGRIAGAPLPGDGPGLRTTAIQIEWAAREIERLRNA